MSPRKHKAVLAVTDGLGFNRSRAREIVDETWAQLDIADRRQLESAARRTKRGAAWGRNLLYPVSVESIAPGITTSGAIEWISDIQAAKESLNQDLFERVYTLVESIADSQRYVPWASGARNLNALRNENLSLPTSASGMWVGFENLEPTIQGNSETGHQQIGNNSLASQLPLEITNSIDSGSFFENSALNTVISNAKERSTKINFCFLLSGVRGNDGRVHSAWNHLEAFLELVFERYKLPVKQVQMQAILDGRDSGIHSSITKEQDSGDFLGRLQNLLDIYDANESLAWVIGRSTAMDRDYRESAAKTDFDLLTGKAMHTVSSFDEVREIISESHSNGRTDQDISPISLMRTDGTKPVLSKGDAFINLNFRSDRQRSKIGFLAGARSLLKFEGESRGRTWDGSWIEHNLNLDICTIAEYHPDFETKYKVTVAFPTKPHPDNFLALWPDTVGSDEYTLIAESVKSSHMGYFFRGRREEPVPQAKEIRLITASHGQEDGVQSDTDFYLHPAMRTREITTDVLKAIESGTSRLICCNLAAPDMVGHLLPRRYEEAKVAYRAAADALVEIAVASRKFGLHMLITSDHGNIEDDTSAHSAHDVLTTVIQADGEKFHAAISVFQARLFDIGPTLFELMGINQHERKVPVENKDFSGRPLIKFGQVCH